MKDVFAAIEADLEAEATRKRRHFLPALVGASSLIVGLLAMAGVREDFAGLPLWRQVALSGSWLVCGLLFPAIGAGLWFPRRGVRTALALGGISLSVLAVVGWPLGHEEPHAAAPCGIALLVLGAGLIGIGALSGAFAMRRSIGSSAWYARRESREARRGRGRTGSWRERGDRIHPQNFDHATSSECR